MKSYEHIELELEYERLEKKMEELYEQLNTVEQERTKIHDVAVRYQEESKFHATELEESRVEVVELKKQLELQEERLSQVNVQREEKLNEHLNTIKELERELDQRGKRLREVQREKEAMEIKAGEETSRLKEEVEMQKDRVMQLQKNDAKVDVWKKRYEDLVHVREELAESKRILSQMDEQAAQLKSERDNNRQIKETVAFLEEQTQSAKAKAAAAEAKLARAELRLKEVTSEKQSMQEVIDFDKQRIEELEGTCKQLQRKTEER